MRQKWVQKFVLGLLLSAPTAWAADAQKIQLPAMTKQECEALLRTGSGLEALRTAPEELKQKIKTEWQSVFRGFNLGWTFPALDVLRAVESDPKETREFVREAIHAYIKRAPRRQTENLLGTSPVLQFPKSDDADINHGELLVTFTEKYGLKKFANITERIFAEILPPEYTSRGVYHADWDFNFSALALGEAFRAAFEVGLQDEAATILRLMVIHEKFNDLGNAAELMGSDHLLYQTGLYMLSKFYFDQQHRYYYNKLWDAIETLKRVRSPEMRAKVRELMIAMTYDIMSPEFEVKLLEQYKGDRAEMKAHMGVLASNLLRGLRSSGDVLYLVAEDSIKVDVVTQSNDPRLREAVRYVLAYNEKEQAKHISDAEEIAALQTTHDKEELLKRGHKLLSQSSPGRAVDFFAAAGDYERTVQILAELPPDDRALNQYRLELLRVALERAGVIKEFYAYLRRLDPQLEPAFQKAAERNAKERFQMVDRMKRRNYAEGNFHNYVEARINGRGFSVQRWLDTARNFQVNKNGLNAGINFMNAAFEAHISGEYSPRNEQALTFDKDSIRWKPLR